MTKKLLCLALVVFMSLGLVACQPEGTTTKTSAVTETATESTIAETAAETTEEVAEPIVIKMSMQASPESAQVVGMRAAAEYINEKSGGKIEFQVYDSASLSPQDTMIVDTQTGQVDMTVPGAAFIAQTYPPMSIMNAPYLFRDAEHMYGVIESGLVDELFQGFEDMTGTLILDYWWLGTRTVSSNIRATTPEEFQGVKMRSPNAEMYIATIQSLGATPTPVNLNETYLALQTGTVDAEENPLNLMMAMKFDEVQKYIIMTNHMVDGYTLCINKDKWESIPADLQQVVLDGLAVGKAKNDEVVSSGDEAALEQFIEAGLEIVEVDRNLFMENARSVVAQFEADWPAGLYDEIVNFE